MAFPGADEAVIPKDKLTSYLLNVSHPISGPKAVWFNSLGYTLENSSDLEVDLLRVARTCDKFISKPSPFGVKYQTSGEIGRPGHRPGLVTIIWLVEKNDPPRLITAFPKD